jgi:hypothetical protein
MSLQLSFNNVIMPLFAEIVVVVHFLSMTVCWCNCANHKSKFASPSSISFTIKSRKSIDRTQLSLISKQQRSHTLSWIAIAAFRFAREEELWKTFHFIRNMTSPGAFPLERMIENLVGHNKDLLLKIIFLNVMGLFVMVFFIKNIFASFVTRSTVKLHCARDFMSSIWRRR